MDYDKKLVWGPSMSVNEEKIDEQHEKLIEQINKMIGILSSLNVDIGSLRQASHFLYTYVKEHLAYEEGYMQSAGYPRFEEHKKIHQDFIQFYKNFQGELKKEMSSPNFSSLEIEKLMQQIKEFLTNWIEHIKKDDQEYAEYVRNSQGA